ncbi:sensor domain-containing diguanylate cyclase [Ancylobacter sp. WKF20]|uniref:sensor domain-containing diguanylate cyclase n=1 Tax=Ancylobacter sp. WKF20 TaxID=3039801 RepID=UPI00243437AA|nr:sensor domain-containing diguanylate cyclase [Ancylobacter sp. WKF20]WGD29248.1 sensor domain-containing diguanylate cyclase [Ancylobacter sp. WKF20]
MIDRLNRPIIEGHEDLHLILDAVPTPLSWATMPDGRIRFVNRAFTKTFGYHQDAFATVDDWIDVAYPEEEKRCRARMRWREIWNRAQHGTTEVPPEEIDVLCADGKTLTVQHRGILLHEAGVAIATFEDISARKLAEDALRRIAFEDPLTGLPNRRALQARWTEAMARQPTDLALMILDLDRFKPVNDRFGHEIGDMVLSMVARRLEGATAPAFVCRLGGDEFAILIEHEDAAGEAERVCAAIAAAFASPFTVGEDTTPLGAAIGISHYRADADNLSDLLRHADEALYRLKRAGRSGHEWYAPQLV